MLLRLPFSPMGNGCYLAAQMLPVACGMLLWLQVPLDPSCRGIPIWLRGSLFPPTARRLLQVVKMVPFACGMRKPAPLGPFLKGGHPCGITALAFSSDGKMLASGGYATVRLWNATTGTRGPVLTGYSKSVIALAFSPDGKRLASGSGDNIIRLWDARTLTPGPVLKGHTGSVYTIAFSPDGKTLASGDSGKTVRLWDSATGTLLQVLPDTNPPPWFGSKWSASCPTDPRYRMSVQSHSIVYTFQANPDAPVIPLYCRPRSGVLSAKNTNFRYCRGLSDVNRLVF